MFSSKQVNHILYKNWEELEKHRQLLEAEGMNVSELKSTL